ncbi:uncharacterized protein LOC141661082 [Apium graveolens]|uniref:uncharacterized protein LOC141661082 n=1 Tax=Apium graveolens TaxID=4045 RepID=UPI003D7BE1FC
MGKDFVWTSVCEEAFQKIKEQLGNPPMLAKPEDGETLILYLAVSEYSISATLVKEEEGRQSPVYYVSKRLLDAETRYISMEKLVYALILVVRKLRPYFQAHWIEGNAPVKVREDLPHPWWVLHVDGAINNNEAGAEIVLVTPEGHRLMNVIHFKFYVTNNDAEYEALINGLKITLERLLGKFGSSKLEGIPREENSNADALEKMGSQMVSILLGQISLGIQEIPSIPEVSVFQMQEIPQETWMSPIHNCIRAGTLPEDKLQARRLRYQAVKYVEYDGVLYKRGFNQPLLRCVDLEEGNYILREVPEELGDGSLRRDSFIEEDAEVNQRLHLNFLDEAIMNFLLKLAAYQQRISRYFNKKVKSVPYKVGYLVL